MVKGAQHHKPHDNKAKKASPKVEDTSSPRSKSNNVTKRQKQDKREDLKTATATQQQQQQLDNHDEDSPPKTCDRSLIDDEDEGETDAAPTPAAADVHTSKK